MKLICIAFFLIPYFLVGQNEISDSTFYFNKHKFGIYDTFSDFKNNIPSDSNSFSVNKGYDLFFFYYLQTNKPIKNKFAIYDNENLYISTGNYRSGGAKYKKVITDGLYIAWKDVATERGVNMLFNAISFGLTFSKNLKIVPIYYRFSEGDCFLLDYQSGKIELMTEKIAFRIFEIDRELYDEYASIEDKVRQHPDTILNFIIKLNERNSKGIIKKESDGF